MRRTRGIAIVTGWTAALCVVAALLAGAGAAHAGTIVVPPRPGQVGFGMSGLYGALLDSGDLGKGFGSGPGLGATLRYRMRYERGFGLVWEQHGLDVREGARFQDPQTGADLDPLDPYYPKKLNLYFYGVELYQMFDTRTKTVKMLSVGGGIAHPVRVDNDDELEFPPGDGFFLSVGGSVERYFIGSLAADLSVRYHWILHEGSNNHDVRASLGFIWYASL